MSRELLKRVLNARTIGYPLPPSIVKDIEAELAKPELDPIAWQYRTYNPETNEIYYHVTKSWLEAKNYDNDPLGLYAHPPTQQDPSNKPTESNNMRELLSKALAELDNADSFGVPGLKPLTDEIQDELAKPEPAIDNDLDWAIRYVIQDICEMSDRTSPDDMPDAMVVTPKELSEILRDHIGKLLADTKAETINNDSEPVLLVNVWRDGNLPCFNNEWLSFPATWENGSYKLYTNPPAQQKPLSDAAPDIYSALERFIAWVDKQNFDYESGLIRQAKAALAKARGENEN